MNNALKHTLREARDIAATGAALALGAPLLPFAIPAAIAGVTAFAATTLAVSFATEAGHAILSELRRRARLRAPRPPSPSLRGTPTAKEFKTDLAARPRTLAVRLRLGSRMADLAPTLDSANRYGPLPAHARARRIAGRGRGLKGWLEDNRIPLGYSTLMSYKLLAIRLRALLRLDERMPLEWLLPGAAPDHPLPPGLLPAHTAARRRLAKLLRAHWNFTRLSRHVNAALGLYRLPTPRRAAAAPLEGDLLENTRRELTLFLQARDLTPRRERLRRTALAWFPAAPPALE